MSGFDPGPGWREVRADEYPETGLIRWTPDDSNQPEVYWVREDPVALPTEPYTVARLTWKREVGGISVVARRTDDTWTWVNTGAQGPIDPRDIEAVEVLAAPPAATAKAVLEEVEAFLDQAWIPGTMRVLSYDTQQALFARVRDRFGVTE